MKIINFIHFGMCAFGALALNPFASRMQVSGGYVNGCQNITIVHKDDHLGLRANCKARNGTSRCSVLRLDVCYEAINGNIKPQNGGRFDQACRPRNCHLDGTMLECRCATTTAERNSWNKVSLIDTDALIVNDDGILRCFDNKATSAPVCTSGSQSKRPHISLDYALFLILVALFLVEMI